MKTTTAGRPLWTVIVVIAVAAVIGIAIQVWVESTGRRQTRAELFAMLHPVMLSNCTLERFGEVHDGGYLMCANLLESVESGYSYGIGGYDKWGCDISTTLAIPVHQYDCFNTTQPACSTGSTNFHSECVGTRAETIDGRPYDTITDQLAQNGHRGKRVVMKIDVESAEWDALLSAPDETLNQIDQLAIEFHGVENSKYVDVVSRLKQFFEVAHLHFNNVSCMDGLDPFPAWAYEALLVNKRLAVVDRSHPAGGPHPLDAVNNPSRPDCQPNLH